MKLSVITINYNNLDGLKQTAESIINQTWKDFEWIIIDGGSTDGSREYIVNINENLNQKGWNPISYWCSESDKGIYNALNKGIFHCNGEFISCMNSGDSFFDSQTLNKVFRQVRISDVLYGDRALVNSDGYFSIEKEKIHVDLYDVSIVGLCHQAMFVKTCYLKQKGFDENYKIVSDCKRWTELALEGCTFEHVDCIVCNYDITGVSSINQEEFHKEKMLMLQSTLPSMLFTSLMRLYQCEEGHIFKRCMLILNNKGVKSKILKFILKIF
jgi:glycosyltransferase involved in cell wall biosynthesis